MSAAIEAFAKSTPAASAPGSELGCGGTTVPRWHVLPRRVVHRPGFAGALGQDGFGRGDPGGLLGAGSALQPIARLERECEPVRGDRADDAPVRAREAVDATATIRQGEIAWAADIGRAFEPDAVVQLPVQQVRRGRTADHGWAGRGAARLEVHPPGAICETGHGRGERASTEVGDCRVRRQADALFLREPQPVLGNGTQDVALARGERLPGPDGRVEEPESAARKPNDARRLDLRAVERSRRLDARARFLAPGESAVYHAVDAPCCERRDHDRRKGDPRGPAGPRAAPGTLPISTRGETRAKQPPSPFMPSVHEASDLASSGGLQGCHSCISRDSLAAFGGSSRATAPSRVGPRLTW